MTHSSNMINSLCVLGLAKKCFTFFPLRGQDGIFYFFHVVKKRKRFTRAHVLRSPFAYRVFSHHVTAAILVSQNKETAAMLVSQTSPLGVELFSYANAFFCSNKFA